MASSARALPRLRHFLTSYGFYVVFVLIIVVYAVWSPRFLTPTNLRNIVAQAMPISILAVGLTFVIITGGIDISVGSAAYLAAVTAALLMRSGSPVLAAMLAGVAVGVIIGCLNAMAITVLRVNPLISTLAMLGIARGLGYFLTNNAHVIVNNDGVYFLGAGFLGPIPVPIIAGGLLLLAGQIVLSKTPYGRHLYAIGNNPKGARSTGINVDRVSFLAYVLSGTTAGIAGVMWLSKASSVSPHLGNGAEFVAITVVVLGGTSLMGGEGTLIPGALFGALMITMIENGLTMGGADPYLYPLVRALVVLVAVLADSLRTGKLLTQARYIRVVEPAAP